MTTLRVQTRLSPSEDLKDFPSEDLKDFHQAAIEKHCIAQWELGFRYHNEVELEFDASEAVYWYNLAAVKGYAQAQYDLSRLFKLLANIKGHEVYHSLSKMWLEKAAEQNHPSALFQLATEDESNFLNSLLLLEKAAEQGHGEAQFLLGMSYLEEGSSRYNKEEGFKRCEEAARTRHISLQFKYDLADLYLQNDMEEKAIYWFKQSAEGGHHFALSKLYEIAIKYLNSSKKQKEGFSLLEFAANQGCFLSEFALAVYYRTGIIVEKNDKKAFDLFLSAAKKGEPNAKVNVALCYLNGLGCEKNPKTAESWFKDSETKGEGPWTKGKISACAESFYCFVKTKSYCLPSLATFPKPIIQNGPTCGLNALAIAYNYAEPKEQPVFATLAHKPQAGDDKDQDVLLTSLQKFCHTPGPLFNIYYMVNIANDIKRTGEVYTFNQIPTLMDYTITVCRYIRDGHVLIVPCEVNGFFPHSDDGKSTHWVVIFGYNAEGYLVTHSNVFCHWNFEDLYQSNKNLPEINPRAKIYYNNKNKKIVDTPEKENDPDIDVLTFPEKLTETFAFRFFAIPLSDSVRKSLETDESLFSSCGIL